MKTTKYYLIILFFVMPLSILYSQATWTIQSPLPTERNVKKSFFLNSNTGWIISDHSITKTTDGGNNWKVQLYSTTSYFIQGNFINQSTGWVLDYYGRLLRTNNGGSSWFQQSLLPNYLLRSIFFLNENIGWVVGDAGSVLKTTNGGNNWFTQNSGVSTSDLYDVFFTDNNSGWICGQNGVIYKTTNSGVNWSLKSSGTTTTLESMSFINANTGWMLSFWGTGGHLIKTTDSGNSWFFQSSDTIRGYSICFFNDLVGWIASGGAIYKSTDGGGSWNTQIYGISTALVKAVSLNDIWFTNKYTSGNCVYKSSNGGSVWESKFQGSLSNLNYIQFINENTGWAVGDTLVYKTTNGGNLWNVNYSGYPYKLFSICFTSPDTGWIATGGSKILKSTNGGLNWVINYSSSTPIGFLSIYFLNSNTGWIGGEDGILKTTNGGLNWNLVSTWGTFYDLQFVSPTIGYGGRGGDVLKTTNGGSNWTVLSNPAGKSLCFLDMYTGWTVGSSGMIRKTTNGGVNWIFLDYPGNPTNTINYNSVCFLDANYGYIVGDSGVIIKTTNGGVNWIKQNNLTNETINSVFFINNQTGWTAGRNGIILNTTQGGIFIPSAPILNVPLNGSINIPLIVTLDWYDIIPTQFNKKRPFIFSDNKELIQNEKAINYIYRLQVSTDSLFNTTIIDVGNLSSSEYTTSTLNSYTKYYWRVNATTSGTTGPWSSIWNFTTILQTPTLISPTNGASSVTLTPLIDWSDVSGATTYNVQVATNPGFSTPVIDLSSLPSSQYQVPSGLLQANTLYYWRASASNSNGTSAWASAWNFTTLALPNSPNLISPTNGSNILTLTPTLDWSDVAGAISYTVQAATDTNFINLAVNQSGLTVSQYTVTSGALTGNTTYYWRARAENGAGSGPWSVRWNFRVITTPPAPNLVAPPNNSTNQSPTVLLDWDSLAAANSYRIQLATDSLFNSVVYDTSGVTRSSLQMRPGILLANVKYYWKVNATNLAGTGPWSVIWNFRVNPTGVYQYSSEIPKKFKLYNNYPNPFNSTTKIRFDIPKNTNVKITIYEISGRQIDKLINENLSAGSYELIWDANNLSSGVYIYRIETESFTDVKRMLLVK